MLCLSVHQPWGSAIVISEQEMVRQRRKTGWPRGHRPAIPKTVENRTWNSLFRGKFAIHASGQMTAREYDESAESIRASGGFVMPYMKIRLGVILGTADLVHVLPPRSEPYPSKITPKLLSELSSGSPVPITRNDLRWHIYDQYGLVLRNIVPCKLVQFKGRQRWFSLPDDVATKIVTE